MKYLLIILSILAMFGCVVDKGDISINFKKRAKTSSDISSASINSVQIINNQLVIKGAGLNAVTNIKVDGNSLNQNFNIESKSATEIVANSISAFSFDVSKVFNLIISDANASATFPIDFSICNATLNGKGFNCSITAMDKDVLSYDAVTGTWKPRAATGTNYLGAFNASTNPPAPAPTPFPSSGSYYIVSADGMIGATPFVTGDWLISNGTAWQKISNSTLVTSVFSRTGNIVAQEGDYDLDKLTDVDLSVAPVAGKVLKFDGAHWVAGDDLSGGGAGSVVTASIADNAVTDAKIVSVAASKITGTLNSTQILDGTIVNADINAAAAIDYSKLNIPAAAIPYAKLNIANGDIPAAKISGLPSATAVLATTVTDGDTTHAPDGNSVFDALGLKLNLTGGTLSVGTIRGVPTPFNLDDVVNKQYTDTNDALKVAKAGDTMSGVLTLDSDLKIKGGSNYVTIKGSASTSANYDFTLPVSGGTNGYILSTNGSGTTSWIAIPSASSIVAGTIVDAHVAAGAAIAQSKIANLTTDLAAKEGTITAGTNLQYYRGDKTWQTLNTTVVPEGSNEYFTKPKVLATDLLGLNTGVNGPIVAADTVLDAMGKLQYQVTDLKSKGQWEKSSTTLYYSAGDVQVDQKLKFKDSGSNFVELKAPATVGTTYTLTLPTTAGSANQVLKTDGAGVLSWTALTDASVQAFAKAALPTCGAGEVLKSNGTTFSCVTDNTGAGAFSSTASRAVATSAGGTLEVSATTATELGYVNGVTSSIQAQLDGKQPTITAGLATDYYAGDKTFKTLDTSAVLENANLYFTNTRARSAVLATTITDADALHAPDGNAVYDALLTKMNLIGGGTISMGTINGVPTPAFPDDVANKDYVDTKISDSPGTGSYMPASSVLPMASCPAGWTDTGTTGGGPGAAFCNGATCRVCQSPAVQSLIPANSILLMETCPYKWSSLGTMTGPQGAGINGINYISCQSPATDTKVPQNSKMIMKTCPAQWTDVGLTNSGPLLATCTGTTCHSCESPGNNSLIRGIYGLSGGTTGGGAEVVFKAGDGGSTSGAAGDVIFTAGNANGTNNGGNIFLAPGSALGTGVTGKVIIGKGAATPTSPLTLNANTAPTLPTPPSETLFHIVGTDSGSASFTVDAYGSNPKLMFRTSNGTAVSPTSVTTDNVLGSVVAYGYGSTAYSSSGSAAIQFAAAESWTDTTQGSYIKFYTTTKTTTGKAERMIIQDNGNVGIGTSTANYKLDVVGGVNASSGYTSVSDRRLKKNIVTIDDALAKVLNLRGVEFDWKKDDEHEIGLIAQEVEAVVPTFVKTGADGFKAVKYSNIVALLIEAMKKEHKQVQKNLAMMKTMQSTLEEHSRKIASLEEENVQLKKENAEIKARLNKLEKAILRMNP